MSQFLQPAPLHVTSLEARRFVRQALLLDDPAPDVGAALEHLGFVQIDPINVCGRMHDLILRLRVRGYRENDLVRHLHPEGGRTRGAFEHHHPVTHILVAFPAEAWPHLLAAMRARARHASRWMGRLTPRERELADRLLAEIAARGPLSSEDIPDGRAARTLWGRSTLVKATLQKLFFHGRLLIADRVQGRRRYDLPERILPAKILARPEPPADETQRWLALLTLKQRRLAALKRVELAAVEDLVEPVRVGDSSLTLHCLKSDVPRFETAASPPRAPEPGLLLAPLDPVIYDRRVTRAVWDFDYVWEAYVPKARRVRGHYALPLLCGTEIVGHVDPKADREAGRLRIVSRSVRRGFASAPAVKDLASFLGLRA